MPHQPRARIVADLELNRPESSFGHTILQDALMIFNVLIPIGGIVIIAPTEGIRDEHNPDNLDPAASSGGRRWLLLWGAGCRRRDRRSGCPDPYYLAHIWTPVGPIQLVVGQAQSLDLM